VGGVAAEPFARDPAGKTTSRWRTHTRHVSWGVVRTTDGRRDDGVGRDGRVYRIGVLAFLPSLLLCVKSVRVLCCELAIEFVVCHVVLSCIDFFSIVRSFDTVPALSRLLPHRTI
jgi:hypothetical protein